MASELFYLTSYKNVGTLFEKIQSAKAPEAFTQKYLGETLGLKATNDRALINMLKKLGFLDASGRPTETYGLLKNKQTAKAAIAAGIRAAYSPLFDADEKANELSLEQLRGLISQLTGSDEKGAKSIAYTFNAIAKLGDFSKTGQTVTKKIVNGEGDEPEATPPVIPAVPGQMRREFHFNIQVHLPANGTEETYLNIFNALRRTFS